MQIKSGIYRNPLKISKKSRYKNIKKNSKMPGKEPSLRSIWNSMRLNWFD
jgi:hypothetical protein